MDFRHFLLVLVFVNCSVYGQNNLAFEEPFTISTSCVIAQDETCSFAFTIPDSAVYKVTHASLYVQLNGFRSKPVSNSDIYGLYIDNNLLFRDAPFIFGEEPNHVFSLWLNEGSHDLILSTGIGNSSTSRTVAYTVSGIKFLKIPID
jgi:hypothetical protein